MKVAVLAHSFPRFPGDTHGPFVKRLSEELARRGHRVWVLVPYDPELDEDPATPLAIRSFRYVWPRTWHRLGYSRTLKRDVGLRAVAALQAPLYFHFARRALERLVRREGIELIHAHWILPNGYVASRVSRATGVPYAATLHGSDVFMAERNPLLTAMARRALAGARHVTSPSPELRDRLLALAGEAGAGGGGAGKVHLVPNGTDLAPAGGPREGALLRRLGLSGGERLVVGVGRLVDKKGFRYLLEGAPRFLEAVPEARIVLGGGGELRETLERQARELGIGSRVLFTGALSHPEVLELVAAAEVFVMPSVRDPRGNVDGLPVVVLEAMAAGRPVVATDVSGIPLAVEDGANGMLVAEKDPEALAAAVARLLADRGVAEEMGRRGRERVARDLNWAAVAAVHDRLYQAAAGGGRAA